MHTKHSTSGTGFTAAVHSSDVSSVPSTMLVAHTTEFPLEGGHVSLSSCSTRRMLLLWAAMNGGGSAFPIIAAKASLPISGANLYLAGKP